MTAQNWVGILVPYSEPIPKRDRMIFVTENFVSKDFKAGCGQESLRVLIEC